MQPMSEGRSTVPEKTEVEMSITAVPGSLAQAHTLISTAFGVGWERIAQWTVIGFVSAWFWTNSVEHIAAMFHPAQSSPPLTAPIAWLIELLDGLGVTHAQWLEGIQAWTTSLQGSWPEGVLVIFAAACATTIARSRIGAGLVTVSTLCLVCAVQISGDFAPVLWFAVVAAIPALIAAATRTWLRTDTPQGGQNTRILPVTFILLRLVGVVFSPILLTVLAPVIAMINLVFAYSRGDDSENAADVLVTTGVRELVQAEANGQQPSSSTVVRILSGLALSDSTPSSRNQLAYGVRLGLDGPSGALRVEHRRDPEAAPRSCSCSAEECFSDSPRDVR